MSVVEISDVSMAFDTRVGRIQALEDVSLTVADGEFACLLGPSGCGKSTLLNVVAGLASPTGGSVAVDGEEIHEPGRDRGMVAQTYTLFPWLKVRANIEFGPKLAGVPRAERARISERLLDRMGLTEFADAYPRELSGGMQQRVAIARAFANEPRVLLMDEPFGALDALTRTLAQDFLTEVWEADRRTILFVTHDIAEALMVGDVLYVMGTRPGRICERIEVEFPRPRTREIEEDPRFGALRHRILNLIRGEVVPEGEVVA
ncbi:MAG TPA: ABC transporter ATP-binding protein [Thermoleophilaceae bacterium]|nr:ABC transporter ATP-binding protein [Thermoleophilaceae bacterium]